MNELETYQKYLALKLHFTTESYDYFKYNGKVSVTTNSFSKRKDKFQFIRLAKKLSEKQLEEYFVANFIIGKNWIGSMDESIWKVWLGKIQSIEYNFANDVETLLTNVEDFDILFKCNEGNHPKLVKAYLGKKISLETLVILEKVLQFKRKFDQQILETFIWPKLSQLISKYDPFVKINIREYRMRTLNIVQEAFFQLVLRYLLPELYLEANSVLNSTKRGTQTLFTQVCNSALSYSNL